MPRHPGLVFSSSSSSSSSQAVLTVELYGDASLWRQKLLGTIDIQNKLFHEGVLFQLARLGSNASLVIKNPPNHDAEYSAFIQALKNNNSLVFHNYSLSLPQAVVIRETEGYDFSWSVTL